MPARLARPSLLTATIAAATVLAAVTLGVQPADADASTYYVSCGSGGGDGSSGSPWGSLDDVRAHGAFSPGQRILLARGTTCHGRIVAAGSGSASSPIVLGAYGSGAAPTVAGGGTAEGTAAIEFDDVANWTVQDLHVTNTDGDSNTRTQRAGVLFRSANGSRLGGLTAQRLTVDGVTSSPSGGSRAWGGIAVNATGGGGFDGMTISGNRVADVGRTGIAVFNTAWPGGSDRNLRITGNRVVRARGDSIVVWGSRNARIDHNTSIDGAQLSPCPTDLCGTMGSGTTASAGIWPINSVGVRIDHNEVSGERAEGGDGEGIDVDVAASQVVVEQNDLHDNAGGGLLFCGGDHVTARSNVLTNNGRAAITFSCGWHDESPADSITVTGNRITVGGAKSVVRDVQPDNANDIAFTNNTVTCSGTCAYAWPDPPAVSGNTFKGSHSPSEPKD